MTKVNVELQYACCSQHLHVHGNNNNEIRQIKEKKINRKELTWEELKWVRNIRSTRCFANARVYLPPGSLLTEAVDELPK